MSIIGYGFSISSLGVYRLEELVEFISCIFGAIHRAEGKINARTLV